MQKICSSNSSAASGICDASKSQAQHYRKLKFGSTLKYLNINHYHHHHHLNSVVNPFAPNAPFLYPLKTSENLKGFQGVEKGCTGNEWVNCKYYWQWGACYSVCSEVYWNCFRINWRIVKGRWRHSLVQDMQNFSKRLVPWTAIHNTAFIMRNCWILKVSRIQSYHQLAKLTGKRDWRCGPFARNENRNKIKASIEASITNWKRKQNKNKPKTTVKTTTTTTKLTATVTARRNSLQIRI